MKVNVVTKNYHQLIFFSLQTTYIHNILNLLFSEYLKQLLKNYINAKVKILHK